MFNSIFSIIPTPQMPQLIHGHNLPLVECIYRLNESIRTYVGLRWQTSGTTGSSLAGHTNFLRAEVGGVPVMGRGKNTYGDYSQVSVSQWNVRNVSNSRA